MRQGCVGGVGSERGVNEEHMGFVRVEEGLMKRGCTAGGEMRRAGGSTSSSKR